MTDETLAIGQLIDYFILANSSIKDENLEKYHYRFLKENPLSAKRKMMTAGAAFELYAQPKISTRSKEEIQARNKAFMEANITNEKEVNDE